MDSLPKSRVGDEEELYYFPSSPQKERSFGLVKTISTLVIFMAGIVLGLSISSHFTSNFTIHSEVFFPKAKYEPHCDGECSGIEKFVTPTHLMHEMSDDELFWRASMVPKKEEYPFERVPKVAFMFLTRGPLPFVPLWEKFFEEHEGLFSVYVHSLPGYKLNVTEGSAFYGRQIPSEEVKWGTVGLVAAEKRLLANALLDFSNERFVLLSESCIPVFNFPTVYKYLTKSQHSFVDSYDEDSWRGRGRYSSRMRPDIQLTQWRKGSQWFELNRQLAVDIVADSKYFSLFKKHCRPSCYPDEHYIPTYLNMFRGEMNANRSVTWVDWSRGGPHPATYGQASVTEGFIREIRSNGTACSYNGKPSSVCYLFARKFAPNALETLLELSSSVMDF